MGSPWRLILYFMFEVIYRLNRMPGSLAGRDKTFEAELEKEIQPHKEKKHE